MKIEDWRHVSIEEAGRGLLHHATAYPDTSVPFPKVSMQSACSLIFQRGSMRSACSLFRLRERPLSTHCMSNSSYSFIQRPLSTHCICILILSCKQYDITASPPLQITSYPLQPVAPNTRSRKRRDNTTRRAVAKPPMCSCTHPYSTGRVQSRPHVEVEGSWCARYRSSAVEINDVPADRSDLRRRWPRAQSIRGKLSCLAEAACATRRQRLELKPYRTSFPHRSTYQSCRSKGRRYPSKFRKRAFGLKSFGLPRNRFSRGPALQE